MVNTGVEPDPGLEGANFIQVLRRRAHEDSEAAAFGFLSDTDSETRLTYGELDRRARAVGAALQRLGAAGQRVLLVHPPGVEFVVGFLGCLYGGAVAVPVYPPRPGKDGRDQQRLRAVIRSARPKVVLGTSALLAGFREDGTSGSPELQRLASDALEPGVEEAWSEPEVEPGSLALLQYTSGSTGEPKGVMLSHGNLLHDSRLIRDAFGHTRQSRGVIWLPPYHDMGLIGGILQPLYAGFPVTLMSPVAFLQRPLRWLQAISRLGATTSGGPNFAYELCLRKVTEEQRAGLDLSRWDVAFCGAEPVRRDTLERFAEAFAPCGFRREAFFPCYGLAEATLIVSGGAKGAAPRALPLDSSALERHRVAETSEPEARHLVGCGRPLADVAIVDPDSGRARGPDEVGEIWVRGAGVAAGYFERPDESRATFGATRADTGEGPWLRTGDLGFLAEGQLFVSGRLKDLIILRGRNHYPQDLEATASGCDAALGADACAAFAVEREGEERLAIAVELPPRHLAALRRARDEGGAADPFTALCRRLRAAVVEAHEVEADEVVLLEPGGLPRTTSGKVRRRACREGLLAGTLPIVSRLIRTAEGAEPSTPAPLDREALQTLPVEERRARLRSLLRDWLARAAGVPAAEVDLACPLAELGLDSIRTAELAFRLELELGVVLSPVELLDGRSVAALVEAAADRVGGGERTPSPGVEEAGDAPVTAGQRALWFLQRLAPDSAAYNVARAAELHGLVDLGALRRAFQALVDRHPALRTTFPEWDGAPVQRIAPAATVSFEEVDATGWTDAALDERLAAEAHRPFELRHGPLFRAHVFTLSPERRVLLLVLHHAVTDLWSLAVLAGELAAGYEAARRGQPSALPRIAGAASAHLARAQQTLLAGAEGERLWAWWREALAGAPAALELPADRPRPAVQRHRGASLALRFAPDFGPKLDAFARSRGATPFMVLLAGLGALLHRYTGERDLVVGSPSAGRDRAGLADAVGYFVNPVPLRLRPEPDLSFDALVARTRETVLGALRHAALPFPVLVERLHPSRDPSRSPVFQVMFALQRAPTLEDALAAFALESPGSRFELGGLVMEPRRVERRSAQVDLAIVAAATRDGFGAVLEYSADLFDAPTVERLARHWSRLVEAALDAPSLPLSSLPLLDEPERRLLQDWSGHAPANAVGRTVPELFEEQVARAPDAPAIDDGQVVLSYREVEARANRLAHHLLRRGLRPETPVAVLVERSPELPIAFLGILKAGATYLPIDPATPDERLRWILQAAGAAVVVTRGALAGRCAGTGAEVVDLDVMAGALAELPSERPPPRALPESAAYLLYTSGSTGRPKGVVVEHRAACNLAGAQIRAFGVGPGDRVLQFSSCGFDVSIMDFLMALATGGTLCIAPREALLPGPELARLLRDRGITVFALVAVVLSVLPSEDLPALRTIISGGEICTEEMVNRWAPGRRLFNVYGPTEATGWCTLQPCVAGAARRPSIGQPHDGHRAYVLDARMAPAPVGVPGELYLGGVGLARGYAGRPDLTAERFVPDPFGGEPGARLYRTGDRVRWLADGTLDFLGRVDDQVKLRGFRVELGEIEAVLLEHPAVREAAVVVRSAGAGSESRLVAYVTPASVDLAAVRAALAARLPVYMVPSALVPLAALPLNANAKVDRRALPPPPAVDEPGLAPPLGEVEGIVAQVLAEVLGVPRVGAHSNFFDDLGGSSLTVAKACALLGQRLGREIPVVTFFERPTVRALAAHLSGAAGPEREPADAQKRRSDERKQFLLKRGRRGGNG